MLTLNQSFLDGLSESPLGSLFINKIMSNNVKYKVLKYALHEENNKAITGQFEFLIFYLKERLPKLNASTAEQIKRVWSTLTWSLVFEYLIYPENGAPKIRLRWFYSGDTAKRWNSRRNFVTPILLKHHYQPPNTSFVKFLLRCKVQSVKKISLLLRKVRGLDIKLLWL